ncbi:hypothetical protein V8E36_008515 [Tilletia maclaganii]
MSYVSVCCKLQATIAPSLKAYHHDQRPPARVPTTKASTPRYHSCSTPRPSLRGSQGRAEAVHHPPALPPEPQPLGAGKNQKQRMEATATNERFGGEAELILEAIEDPNVVSSGLFSRLNMSKTEDKVGLRTWSGLRDTRADAKIDLKENIVHKDSSASVVYQKIIGSTRGFSFRAAEMG